jgi:hypothetical protein
MQERRLLTEPILVDRNEAARLLSISVCEIDAARRRGDLGARKYGSKVLFEVGELRRFAAALPADEPGLR